MAFGIAVFALPAIAQQYDHDVYDKSVFSDFRNIQAVDKNAMMATNEKVKAIFPGWNASIDKLSNNFLDIYGDAISVPGNTVADKAQYLMTNKLKGLSVDAAEWQIVRNQKAPHASYVDFDQYINGHQVVFSRLSFRFTTSDKLVRVRMDNYGHPLQVAPALDRAAILRTAALTKDLSNVSAAVIEVANDWVWFPVPTAKGYEVKPSWAFTVSCKTSTDMPMELKGYIDGMTGELLYRTNDVKEAFNVTVKSDSIYNQGYTNPVSTQPLANLALVIGASTYYSDAAGLISASTPSAPQNNLSFKLQGRWSVVRNVTTSGAIPTFTQSVATNGTTVIYSPATSANSGVRHINAYKFVNDIHDLMKSKFPAFTGVDVALPTVIDVAGNTCNAFYSNTTINFYAAGGACNSFANINDIIYHEYGHFFSDKFYRSIKISSSMTNGALNEGCSDVWAFSITKDSIIGRGSYVAGGNIRSYGETKVYPQDIKGEVHADGEIIAGSWLHVAFNTGSFDTMTNLFAKTYYDVPDGPTGTEGKVFHDVLVSAILNDDNDGLLNNGTPHMAAIVKAFADHGIYLLSDAILTHTELSHQPSGQPVPVTAKLTLTEEAFFQDLKLFYSVRSSNKWDSVALTNTGNFNYTGQLPAQAGGTIVDYYFAVYDALGNSTFGFPNGFNRFTLNSQVTIPYQYGVGINQVLKMDFETPATTWTIGNVAFDNATNGKWIQAVPVASAYQAMPMQTGADHTSGTGQCLVTANGTNVDNGRTTAQSPVFDLTAFVNPVFEYYRWFSNDRGSNARSDAWSVQVRDSSSVFWKNVDYTYQSDYSWRRRIFAVQEYLPNSKYVQIKFIATDAVNTSLPNNGQNNIEAAVDDFAIYDMWAAGINGVEADAKAKIYPNPADNTLNISLPKGIKGSLGLYDMTGKAVVAEQLDGNTNLYRINTTQLPAGTYMLMIQADKLIQSQKVVISH